MVRTAAVYNDFATQGLTGLQDPLPSVPDGLLTMLHDLVYLPSWRNTATAN